MWNVERGRKPSNQAKNSSYKSGVFTAKDAEGRRGKPKIRGRSSHFKSDRFNRDEGDGGDGGDGKKTSRHSRRSESEDPESILSVFGNHYSMRLVTS